MRLSEAEPINLSQIYELISPMDRDPGDCQLFEQILASNEPNMKELGWRWTREFMIRLGNAHPIHNNPSVHESYL